MPHFPTRLPLYGWLMLFAIAGSMLFWVRLARRDRRLFLVYLGTLGGAFIGAKLVYLLAEGWMHLGQPDMWLHLATGKSILGGLLGGYAAAELSKSLVGYRGITGDWFALLAPAGIALGRIGCWVQGCCRGIECPPAWFTLTDSAGRSRWPAVPVEFAFNLLALGSILFLRQRRLLLGQHFHLYLIAYGAFRFLHEFLREEPRLFGPVSAYQLAALGVFALGVTRFLQRRQRQHRVVLLSPLDAVLELD